MAREPGVSGGISMMVAVQQYLDERRLLGFELIAPGTELMRFARYADARDHRGPLTQELIVGWAREHVKRTSAVTAARRLECVRPFVAYYRQFEPASEIPPLGILGRGHRRLVPHIYTDQEVVQLLQATNCLTPHDGLRPLTYRTLFGLIAATGLRLSEALNLTIGDVELTTSALTVRQTKFRKSRCLPLHTSVVQALGSFRQSRDRCLATDLGMPFFVSQAGAALPRRTVENVFLRMQPHLGWQPRGDYPVPRIHDLRHTFAVRRLQRWREEDQSIDHALFWLCTYLGHAKISDTYWYLTGVPELMDSIGTRFERFTGPGATS
jgi:integrase/recombinase XerC